MKTIRSPLPAPPGWVDIRSSSGRLMARYHPGDDRLWLRNGRDEKFVSLSDLRGDPPG